MSKYFPAQKLNKKVILQMPKEIPDQSGGYQISWVTLGNMWAEVQALNYNKLSLSEQFHFGQLLSLSAYQITIRYRSIVKTTMRIIYDNRIFNIRRIINVDEQSKLMKLIVEEGIEDGVAV